MFTAHAAGLNLPVCKPRPNPVLMRGLSLVEAMCCLAIGASLVGVAVPGFGEVRMRQQLKLSASQLAANINLARSSAMLQGKSIRLTWRSSATGSCYMVHSGSASLCNCDAGGSAACSVGAALVRSEFLPNSSQVALSVATTSILFDAQKGTVTPTATLKLTDTHGRAIHQVVNIMGRLRSCSPHAQVAGMAAC